MLKLATEEDYSEILRMAKAFHKASPYKDLLFSEDNCRQMFDHYLRGDKTEMVIILAVDRKPFGMLIGACGPNLFTTDRIAQEVAWWVDEDHRGSRDSILMKKAYEDWAKRVKARMTQMAMLDEVTNLDKFYRRSGFIPAERSYIKDT